MDNAFIKALLDKAAELPRGAFATCIEPRAKAAAEGAESAVEVRRFDSIREAPIETSLTPRDLRALVQLGLFELDSDTGDDPNLSCAYSHYCLADDEAIRERLGPELNSLFEEARILRAVDPGPRPTRKPGL